jgi:hypothetical protein
MQHDARRLACSCLLGVCLAVGGCNNDDAKAVMPGVVGANCLADTDCRTGLRCLPLVSAYPDLGSVCTRPCTYDQDCPTGTRCGPSDPEPTGFVFTCVPSCDRRADLSTQCPNSPPIVGCEYDGVCAPFRCGCTGTQQCDPRTGDCISGRTATAHVDDPCTTDADCRPPRGTCSMSQHRCIESDCDRGGADACPTGETCTATSLSETADSLYYTCARSCVIGVDALGPNAGGACVNGQICVPHDADPGGMATSDFCSWTDNGFVAGNPSAHVGDACVHDADCPSPFGYGVCTAGQCALRYCATSAFAGRPDPCGPNARCVSGMSPQASTRELATAFRAGTCLRTCSPTGGCPSGMICQAAGNYCQRDCRIDPSVCPATVHCGTDGTCT